MIPLRQAWPEDVARRYREKGYWTGETFSGFLRRKAVERPDAEAIIDRERRWTYAELLARAEAAAAGFLRAGLRPGDRVVVQLPNIAEFFAAVFGLFRAGMVPLYALPAHRITEIAHFARTSEAVGYVIAERHDGFDYCQQARALRAEVPAVRHVVVASGDAEEFILLATEQHGEAVLPPDATPSDVAFIQISGGSTGLSKLISRTHDDYLYSCRASNEICGVTENSVFLVALPAAHNFPMSSPGHIGALHAGAKVVLSPSPSPDVAFPLIEREKVTITGLVPPLALLWMQAAPGRGEDLSSLDVLLVGGAKFAEEAARRVRPVLGCQLQQVFGMAEGLVNYTRQDDPEEIIVSTQGRPISPDDEVLVLDDGGNPVPEGQPGHLLTRGPYTIRNYHNDDAANARSFTEDGFYRTGDIVRRLPGGYLEVRGRAGDHINRAGEKISAEEVENHLLAHPGVFDAAIVSIPDPYLGERSCAFVIAQGEKTRAAVLKHWMRQRGIAEFKVPDQIVFVEAFATTAAGKISRKELRARLRDQFLQQR
ncbi:(2,3-dihydroxybenzoyl)adenylate synthase [Teichococcus vastitatis]|uniref:(2,3-dihydroxybenzoyl)adenylate synthase n=1 Tax=Teichococcus vastitatis TaxID=2307076 RepID=A0ABS9WAE9_9PROT|nr:(2,3-dihydroxybenzoyl)adenylate synthase [Pseudoroseomonas vastitatis]MCI0755860.1 (2,3-dihydroxybenzoyl)adenylate synthase [Pseudoroseomonas vastitatis]